MAILGKITRQFFSVQCCALLLTVLLPHFLRGQRATHDPDSFACSSRNFMLQDFKKQPVVSSPDKTRAIQLTKDFKFRIKVANAVISEVDIEDISADIEIGWSPDSSHFFISYSSGGAVGRYHVRLFRLTGQTLTNTGANIGATIFSFWAGHQTRRSASSLQRCTRPETAVRTLVCIAGTQSGLRTDKYCMFLARRKPHQSRKHAGHQGGSSCRRDKLARIAETNTFSQRLTPDTAKELLGLYHPRTGTIGYMKYLE